MGKPLFELAADIVHAQAGVAKLAPEEIETLIARTYNALKAAKEDEEGIPKSEENVPVMDPRKSIKQVSVTCLECGKAFKILTKRHLGTHGLTPKAYREKWGFKAGQPLTARSVSIRRKQIAKEKNIGETLKQARMAKKKAAEEEATAKMEKGSAEKRGAKKKTARKKALAK